MPILSLVLSLTGLALVLLFDPERGGIDRQLHQIGSLCIGFGAGLVWYPKMFGH